MFAIILSLLCSIRQGFRARAAIQAEILALRHQLLVLQRSAPPHEVRLTASDRFLWVWLSRLWREWRSALVILDPTEGFSHGSFWSYSLDAEALSVKSIDL